MINKRSESVARVGRWQKNHSSRKEDKKMSKIMIKKKGEKIYIYVIHKFR